MFITDIKLQNFRNYQEQEITLQKDINIFFGDNAQGKTNILEAIFLCAIGKSFRTNKEKEMIKIGSSFSTIEINYQKKDRQGKIKVEINDKKNISINGIKIKKLSELLGNINVVIFTPDDINILKSGPANRRRFLDMMIGQLRPNYVYCLNQYLKILEQRNNYLRQIKFENKNEDLLEIWDEKLADTGIKIYEYRKEFIQKIISKINKIHEQITDKKEELKIEYLSDIKEKETFLKHLKNARKIDMIKGYTTKGIHRDDFTISINDKLVNVYGSQGQHRTAILSLKLAELQVVEDEIEEKPILLLDDFMSELDEKRRKNFLQNIRETQVIITCTEEFNNLNLEKTCFQVKKGEVIPCTYI